MPMGDGVTHRRSACRAAVSLRFLVAGLLLLACAPAPVHARFSFAVRAGAMLFRDERLTRVYGHPPVAALVVRGPRVGPLAPAIALGLSWSRHRPESVAFVDAARSQMRLAPCLLQVPIERRIGSRWLVRAGPQAGFALIREEWRAAIPMAGLTTRKHATTDWLAAGWLAEAALRAGRAGTFGLGAEALWARGERVTIAGNESQVESITAGWSMLRIEWTPTSPAQP
jgi:hypothetical protein